MFFVGDAGGEIQTAVRQDHSPQAVKGERNSERVPRCALENAVVRIVNVDFAVPEIANPKLAIHNFKSPWRVQSSIRNEAAEQLAVGVEHINVTKSGASEVVIRVGWIDLRECDENLAVEIANPKRRVIGWNIWIGKRESALENKASVVGLDLVGMKIRHVKIILAVGDTVRRAFVNRVTRSVVDRPERLGVTEVRVPARNHSIFTHKNHFRRQCVRTVSNS